MLYQEVKGLFFSRVVNQVLCSNHRICIFNDGKNQYSMNLLERYSKLKCNRKQKSKTNIQQSTKSICLFTLDCRSGGDEEKLENPKEKQIALVDCGLGWQVFIEKPKMLVLIDHIMENKAKGIITLH